MHKTGYLSSTRLGRRAFLATTGGGAAAAVLAPAPRIAEAKTAGRDTWWQMRLSTSSIHYIHLPIEQACARIARLGFEGIDIWSAHNNCPHLDDVAERLGPNGLRAVLAKHKLKLFSFTVYQGGYPRYAKLLGQVGGGLAVRGSAPRCKPDELTARMRAFLDGLKPEIDLATKHGSYLAIENHGHALLNSLDSFKAFVDMNRSPRLGIALAPYHLQRINTSVEEVIAVCGKQLLFFYAWQHAEGIRQLPGHGPIDFTPWIAALANVRYAGYVNPFMHGDLEPDAMSAALTHARETLMECYAKVQGETPE